MEAQRKTIYIHTNRHEIVAARVAAYSHIRHDPTASEFCVQLIRVEDFPWLQQYHGHKFIRRGRTAAWYADLPQAFLPIRMAVPEVNRFQGVALLTDPDVFATRRATEIFDRDWSRAAVYSRPNAGDIANVGYNTSVMVMDCTQLQSWRFRERMEDLFAKRIDMQEWFTLQLEPLENVAPLEAMWNDYDHLDSQTRLLHTTNQITQPWKTGNVYDEDRMNNSLRGTKKLREMVRTRGQLRGVAAFVKHRLKAKCRYLSHPDHMQERLFIALLKEALDTSYLDEKLICDEIRKGHVRRNLLQMARSCEEKVEDVVEALASHCGQVALLDAVDK